MYLKQGGLLGAKEYYFLLEAWNPNSELATLRYEFLVNLPPFGGSCGITPNEGKELGTAKLLYRCINSTRNQLIVHAHQLCMKEQKSTLSLSLSWLVSNLFAFLSLGFASETLFMISCVDWQEWRNSEGSFTFEYRVRQKNSRRSFLLFFGSSVVSDPIELPVGNPDVSKISYGRFMFIIYNSN